MFQFICRLFTKQPQSSKRRLKLNQNKHRRLQLEGLEGRELFAAVPVAETTSKPTYVDLGQAAYVQSATNSTVNLPTAAPRAQMRRLSNRGTLRYSTNAAVTGTLARNMPANDPQLWLNSWGAFPVPTQSNPFTVQIDNEQIKVFSKDTTTQEPIFAVQRGVNGTTPAFHAAGATVTLLGQGTVTAGTQVAYANFGGALWQHVGTDKNTGWSKIWDTGVTSFSASTAAPNTVFVNIGGALWHHVGTDRNSGWSKLWDSGVKQVSAGVQAGFGQERANTVFVLFNSGALYEHVGTDKNSGWFKIFDSGVTQISASQGKVDTVFARFGGAVWEHRGRDSNSGWTKVWDTGATDIAASSSQADTVFVNFGGALWQHSGLNSNAGWAKVWDTGVSQISVASTQPNTVYVTINGALYQHTGLDRNAGWSKIWDTGVTQIAAAPQDDTVFALINGGLWGHVGKDKNSGWFKVYDSGVTGIGSGL